jgi:hypothetical protein
MRVHEFQTELWLPVPPDVNKIFTFRARALRKRFYSDFGLSK